MTNKVYNYSIDVAKANGNHTSLFLACFFLVFPIILGTAFLLFIPDFSLYIAIGIMFAGVAIGGALCIDYFFSQDIKVVAYAVTDDNKIYRVIYKNVGNEYYVGGYVIGRAASRAFNNKNIRYIGRVIGTHIRDAKEKAAIEDMSHEEFVKSLIDESYRSVHTQLHTINKVYNIIEKKRKFVIDCDLENAKNTYVKRKKISIYKAYEDLHELIGYINNKR